MHKNNDHAKVRLLEIEILKLKAEYAKLLKHGGKFNELKDIKIKLRAFETELNLLL